jgi:hypothetical protein
MSFFRIFGCYLGRWDPKNLKKSEKPCNFRGLFWATLWSKFLNFSFTLLRASKSMDMSFFRIRG